jgi:hypothetical protein
MHNVSSNLLNWDSLKRILIAAQDIRLNTEETQQTILRGHDRYGNGECSSGGQNVIRDSKCVVKVGISQHKVTARGVGGVGRPSECDTTPGRGIVGGYR